MEGERKDAAPLYRMVLTPRAGDEGVEYVARAPEIPDCEARGGSRTEAVSKLEDEISARLHNMKEEGLELPLPVNLESFDGQLAANVTPELHRELAFAARAANLDVGALIGEILAGAAGAAGRGAGRSTGAGRDRQQGGRRRRGSMDDRRYHGIMENRASFIEYVRQLERDGGPAGSGRGGRGGGGRGGGRGRRS